MDAARESFKQNMKTKHPSKSTGQGPGAPVVNIDYNERVKGKVEYVGFFGSWDSPKYRFFFTFIRIIMAGIFVGLLYVNASIVCDEWFRAYILNNELHLWFLIIADGALLLMLGLLSSVAYKFYRHLKREKAYIEDVSSSISTHSHRLYVHLKEAQTELWYHLVSLENLLVQSACVSHNPSGLESCVKFTDTQFALWKQFIRLERIFGSRCNVEDDPDLNSPSSMGLLPCKPLLVRLEALEDGLRDLFESSINLKDDLTASDIISKRLVQLETLCRSTMQSVISTEASLNDVVSNVTSALNQCHGSRADNISLMSIRVLNISNRMVYTLNDNCIYTIGDLLSHDSDYYRLFLNAADVDMIVNAVRVIDPFYGCPKVAKTDYEEPELMEPFDDSDISGQ